MESRLPVYARQSCSLEILKKKRDFEELEKRHFRLLIPAGAGLDIIDELSRYTAAALIVMMSILSHLLRHIYCWLRVLPQQSMHAIKRFCSE